MQEDNGDAAVREMVVRGSEAARTITKLMAEGGVPPNAATTLGLIQASYVIYATLQLGKRKGSYKFDPMELATYMEEDGLKANFSQLMEDFIFSIGGFKEMGDIPVKS